MDFLIDASMPRCTSESIEKHSHRAFDVRDLGMSTADDESIAAYALLHEHCIVTRDFDFADVRNFPPEQYSGIVVVELPNTANATAIGRLIDEFLQMPEVIRNLPGRLAILEIARVRWRPPI